MQIFTFFLCQPDGSAASFEARPFVSDLEAVARSRVLLGDHLSASMISVWDGDRSVHQERRCAQFAPLADSVHGRPLGQVRDVCQQCARSACALATGPEH